MNEEELAALADKLLAHGVPESQVLEHLRRTVLVQQPPQETSPVEAFATHAYDALVGQPVDQLSGIFPVKPILNEKQGAADRQQLADERAARAATLNSGEEEHPTASNWGTGTGLAIPLASPVLAKGVEATAAMLGKSGRTVGRFAHAIAKGVAGSTRTGRGIARGLRDFKASTPAAAPEMVSGYEPIGATVSRATDVPDVPVREAAPSMSDAAVAADVDAALHHGETVLERAARTGVLADPNPVRPGGARPTVARRAPTGPEGPTASTWKPMDLKTPGYDAAVAKAMGKRSAVNAKGPDNTFNEIVSTARAKRAPRAKLDATAETMARVQKGVPQATLNYRDMSMKERLGARLANLSNDELTAAIESALKRNDSAAQLYRDGLLEEATKRGLVKAS